MAADRIVRENSGFCMVFPIDLQYEPDAERFHRVGGEARLGIFDRICKRCGDCAQADLPKV